jgi:peptidoglycan LD-endopeptidase CwlK
MINSRSLNDLHPYVKQKAIDAIAECKSNGIDLITVSTLRDQEYQTKLFNQGRTTKGNIVTNAKLIGPHGFAIALDVCPLVNGKCAWNRIDLFDKIAVIFKKHGFEWGGDWKSIVDKPHFQMTLGLTATELRSGKFPKFPTKVSKSDFENGISWMIRNKIINDSAYWNANALEGKTCVGEHVRTIIERLGKL